MKSAGISGCGCFLIYLVIGFTLGAYCFGYVLDCSFGTDVHWTLDLVGGVVLGSVTIPAAIVCKIVKVSGVKTPFFGDKVKVETKE